MRDLLITVPHHAGHAPTEVLAEMLGPAVADDAARAALLRRLWLEGDPHTDTIFLLPGARTVSALVSRFVVDLNRGRDEHGPNGVVKSTDFAGRPLYPAGEAPDATRIEERLLRHYDPFHAAVQRELERERPLLLLDAHSMTPRGPRIGPDDGTERPASCLITGGDADGEPVDGPTSLPAPAARAFADALRRALAPLLRDRPDVPPTVTLNRPFDRGEIQRRYGDPAHPAATPTVSLEFNRALFEEEDGSARPGAVGALRTALGAALREARPALERAAADRRRD